MFDYDKWLRDNFYGIGNSSAVSNVERYTRIPMSMEIDFNRGFSSVVVGQLKIRYMSVENINFEPNSRLAVLPPSLNSGTVTFSSAGLTVRYDTRNSFTNASSGIVMQGESEISPGWRLGNTSFTRLAGCIQYVCDSALSEDRSRGESRGAASHRQ